MSSSDHRWTMAGVAGAGRSWISALLSRQRRLWVDVPSATAWSDDSRMGLDDRILATRSQIATMHRSLAMQQHALDATRRAGQRITTGRPSQPTTAATAQPTPEPGSQPDDDDYNDYPETEPMSAFMENLPFPDEPARK